MKTNITELVFILDKSGSMSGLENDTIGGYNAMLRKQQEESGKARITTVLFSDEMKILHDQTDIMQIKPMTSRQYLVGGSTALLDTIGSTIHKIGNSQKYATEEFRADKVMVVITTDGMENSSREYTYEKIKHMIERQKSRFGWEFIFLGADIEAVAAAAKLGIEHDRAVNFNSDSEGTRLNYKVISDAVSTIRANKTISEDWKIEIETDFENRGKGKKK
ncbi:MAG: vWA domain-containing protein [Clostridiaceae bacterium]